MGLMHVAQDKVRVKELQGSIKYREFLCQLRNCQFLHKVSAVCSLNYNTSCHQDIALLVTNNVWQNRCVL